MGERYIGLMSGTSLDAIDSVLVEVDGIQSRLLAAHSHPWPSRLREELLQLIESPFTSLLHLGQLDTACGEVFAAATLALLEQSGHRPGEIHAIGSHGQTLFHAPTGQHPFSLQIGDPNVIAERTGITTVADLRRRDIAAGGQGAPLVPAFHAARFRNEGRDRVVLNIGGIANITRLPADPTEPVTGYDTGPGNLLLDGWTKRHLQQPFDRDGAWAANGCIDQTLLSRLLDQSYFALAPPKSTGRELFNLAWLDNTLSTLGHAPAASDIQATLLELTCRSISDEVEKALPHGGELLVCGGGAHNSALLARLDNLLPSISVTTTAQYGLDPDWVEGVAFAWLAAQTLNGRTGNLPVVTGARHPVVLGGIYPGNRAGD